MSSLISKIKASLSNPEITRKIEFKGVAPRESRNVCKTIMLASLLVGTMSTSPSFADGAVKQAQPKMEVPIENQVTSLAKIIAQRSADKPLLDSLETTLAHNGTQSSDPHVSITLESDAYSTGPAINLMW